MGIVRVDGRNRVLYAGFVASTVAIGLASRRFGDTLPTFIAAYLPDALYALMVFLLAGLIFPKSGTVRVALAALLFCYAIEASQLYQAPWINAVRQTRLGGLVLGFGFLWSDILCYTVGVAAGVAGEWMHTRERRKI
ncbi:MAG: DUF2809 domain-containing protein [Armatimonadetes bacterium]|nr:DUF2809 domain-containing protein [Armatimonadota bacterium]